ncbi:sodium/proton-translocating pyrophosphatase [Candidatus Saccharibacteria bacterium]|nr:sodium/proton-translocating pyrophosphatase [Candidatus Saccharibacteria bacterium]
MTIYYLTLTMVACAFSLIGYNFINLRKHNEGTAIMIERAAIIRSGAKTFLKREYRVISIVVILMSLGFALIQEPTAGCCLVLGAVLVLCGVEIGMRGGAYGNVRTANAARVTGAISRTLRIATLGGSISGFSVPAFGLLGFTLIFLWSWANGPETTGHGLISNTMNNVMAARLTAYSLGFSMVAIFNRVAGGTYTKSADIANDIVSKSEYGLEEDDPRNVCSIADLTGDLVNDLAGNLSDLGESYVATLMSCILISVQNYATDHAVLPLVCAFPFVLAAGGLFSTLISVMFIILKNRKRHKWVQMTLDEFLAKYPNEKTRPKTKVDDDNIRWVWTEYSLEIDDPGKELNMATAISAAVTLAVGLIGAHTLFGGTSFAANYTLGWASPWLAAALGVVSSVTVGLLTERYTSMKSKFVQQIAKMAPEGHSFVVSEGMAVGNHSVTWPSIIIALSIVVAFLLCGVYGIAIAAVGMLSFVGTTVTIDAFGPIADNAGGIAESCHLPEEVREITDELDALGNTTAAVGKGNAIGAAAFSTITMLMAFIGNIPEFNLNSADSIVRLIVGGIIGMAVIREFISILTKNTLSAAWKLAGVAESELKDEAIMAGKKSPDYNKAIEIASDNALKYMSAPSLLSVVSVLVVGLVFGPITVLGMLLGSTLQAIGEAFFNGNAGGAYDNAKKYIEMGMLPSHGKHSAAHLATITGDTIGDIMKDVVAVCCDICIKIMATVATAMAVMFHLHHFF